MTRTTYISDPSYSPTIRFSLRMVLLAFALLAPLLWLVATIAKNNARHEAEIAARNKGIWATLLDVAKAAEQIRTTKDRAPNDREEIEAVLGHPLSIGLGLSSPVEIHYVKTSPTSYKLGFNVEWLEGFTGDYMEFDSTTPKADWTPIYN